MVFFAGFFVSHGCKLLDFVGLWLSYNWAWSGPGAAVLSDVDKPKQKQKKKKVAHQQAVIMARR